MTPLATARALTAACLLLAPASGRASTAENLHHAVHVVVVLDASGSMSDPMPGTDESRMKVAKSALLEVVSQLPSQTNLGLLVFSGENKPNDWVYPLSPIDTDRFAEALEPITPHGGTPLGRYLKSGADRLLEQRQTSRGYGTYRLILVTDGQASDARLVDRYTPLVLARGIITEVIGVAMQSDHALATHVHAYRRADDPESLTRALASSIAEIAIDDSDTADQVGFDEVAGLPNGVADALLGALRDSGNHPIGTAPKVRKSEAPVTATRTPRLLRAIPPESPPSGLTAPLITLSLATVTSVAVLVWIVLRIAKRKSGRRQPVRP